MFTRKFYLFNFFAIIVIIWIGHSTSEDLQYDNGEELMYFPDENGVPILINLTVTPEILADADILRNGDDVQFEFRLYTRTYKTDYILLDKSASVINDSLTVSLKDKPLKIITHGWRITAENPFVIGMKDAYLEMGDVNVICLDWSTVADNLYLYAALRTWHVGVVVAGFLNALQERYDVTEGQVHLIGHSLGAHVMGVAGSRSVMNVSRITGLDPALPFFKIIVYENIKKLDPTDAQFVDVIHTCAGVLGFVSPLGTVDFYPNGGGPPQPGCTFTVQNLIDACSHSRSHQLFIESIRNPGAFPAYNCSKSTLDVEEECEEASYMGESVDMTMSGTFYLTTNSEPPFGKGNDVLT